MGVIGIVKYSDRKGQLFKRKFFGKNIYCLSSGCENEFDVGNKRKER